MINQEDKNLSVENTAFILDGHLLFAESFASLLKTIKLFTHVLLSEKEEEMLAALKTKHISHLFIDYNIRGLNTNELIKNIKRNNPDLAVIVIGSTDNIFLIRQMLAAKAHAFITKHTGTYEIEMCLRSIKMGRVYVAEDLKTLLKNETEIFRPLHFTSKEILVLQFIAKGYTILETASALCLSKHTIVAHRRKIMQKSGLNTATGLVKFAYEAGLVNK